jgi:serine/threonine protein kinase
MIGKTISHYRIVEKLGAGGMGAVHLAHDEHLQRDVAVKVLPRGTLADESARKRFRKEALALSKLSHPNIATVYDFDTQDGIDFLAMEYISGAALTGKLASEPLPEKEVIALGTQMAAAPEEAHEHGIVHRDLKPGNIMVTPKGQVKVLDFGLAKLVQPVSDAASTETAGDTQGAAGTLPYMAPEQLRSETVDARTDIHAAGAVLYEMSSGRQPCCENTAPRLIDAILHQMPSAPRDLNPRISPRFEELILKCLDKDPGRRYQSAQELRVDLQRLAAPVPYVAVPQRRRLPIRWVLAPALALAAILALLVAFDAGGLRQRLLSGIGTPRIESLAVLPLENLSGDPSQEVFANGMTEALTAELSKIKALKKVISRTSMMQYKGTSKPIKQIASELGVLCAAPSYVASTRISAVFLGRCTA